MLKVWIPGTTDTRDQGLGGVTWANSGVTIDSSGKLGKCLYSGSGNMTTSNFLLSAKWSYSCWWKDSNTSAGWQYIFLLHNGTQNDSNSQMAFLSYPTQSRCEVCSNGKWYSTQAYTPGTWNHIAATYDGTTCKVYFNGIYTTSFTPGQTVTGTNLQIFKSANVYLNDLRIWDNEVISAKEIELLSRGLVLHYPLAMPGGANLGLNTGHDWAWSAGTGNWSFNRVFVNPSPLEKTTYTVSANVEVTGGSFTKVTVIPYNSGTTTMQGTRSDTPIVNGRISTQVTVTGDAAEVVLLYAGVAGATAGNSVIFRNIKIEKGTVATPWIPNTSDSEYSKIGFSDGIEYDVSGNQHNGTKTGTFAYDVDTPRYNTSTIFNGSNHIAVGRLPITDELTYSWWGYSDNWGSSLGGSMVCSVEGGGMGHQNGGSTYLWFICGTGTSSNDYGSGYQMPAPSAGWHMFTETWDGYRFKVYLDGELKFTNERYTTKTPVYYSQNYNFLFLGGESGGSATTPGDHFIGKLSDARVYATTLSAEDVAELYNTPISLSNNGTLLGYEYVEV